MILFLIKISNHSKFKINKININCYMFIKKTVRFIVLCIITMVFIFDGNSEIAAHA